ncbi:MAG: hypothetical protein FJ295_15980 [Planctomycetes bacterium]|nr:hypothetical protein [Planctomycetota bacterium]
MGDCQNGDLRVGFDRRLKLKFLGSQITSDAGLLAHRELDETLGLTEIGAEMLTDSRQGSNKRHQILPLLRQSVLSRLAGYEDVNDAERLCLDPTIRYVVGGRAALPENRAASASEVGRFETETLSTQNNLTALREKLIKIGAKVTRHSKYVTFCLAEVVVTRNLFAAILERIARLAIPPPVPMGGMPG